MRSRNLWIIVSSLPLVARTQQVHAAEALAKKEEDTGSTGDLPDAGAGAAFDPAQLEAISRIVHEQVVTQLSDFHQAYQQLASDFRQLSSTFHLYQEQHRNDLETLEKRLRDDYAQDMGGMELWMRQEHGRAISELKSQHHGALVLLREELLDHVQQHADRVTELDCKVKEGLAIWSSVVDATIQVAGAGTGGEKGNTSGESSAADWSRIRSDAVQDLPKDASWFSSNQQQQRLRSGSNPR